MSEADTTEWPREIWAFAIDHSEYESSGTYATSEWATVPRWDGDPERDRPSQRYVDGDIYDSAERYWRERVEALEAKLAEATRAVEAVREPLEFIESQRRRAIAIAGLTFAPEDHAVLDLCERYGFGAVMGSAARQWAKINDSGAHFVASSIGDTSFARAIRALPLTEEEG